MLLRLVPIFLGFIIASVFCSSDREVRTEEDLGVKYANRCEVCKVLATELQNRLEETGKVRDVIEIGYSLDDVQPKKRTKYQKSELRLIESLDGVCEKILEYNIHKERQDSSRFAKGMSQTFKTLHGLVDKGVKVDLGIPYELWDKPSAEITHLKTQCETLLEENEDAIEYWYWNLQGKKDLKVHLCEDSALSLAESSCLYENNNLRGDIGQSFDTKKAEPNENSKNSNESDEEDFEYDLNSDRASEFEHDTPKAEETSYEEETEHQKAAKEKFAKLYESGSVDFHDPNTVIDFSPEQRRKDEKNNIKPKKVVKPNHINEELMNKPVAKNDVFDENPGKIYWYDEDSNPLPDRFVDVDDTEKAHKGDEFISNREEL